MSFTKLNIKKRLALSIFLLATLITSVSLLASENVNFTITSDWGSGFVADVAITNDTKTTSDGWQLEFDFPYNITNI